MSRLVRLAALVAAAVVACRDEPRPAPSSEPVSWSAAARVDRSEVQVGDDLELTVTVSHPPGSEFLPPPEVELEPFEVLETRREEIAPSETELRYRIAAYRLPEELEIGPLTVRYRDGSGELEALETEPVRIRLVTSLTADVTEIHDIKEPAALRVPRNWRIFFWLAMALLAAVVAYIIYRKLQRRPEDASKATPSPPLPPPEVEAETALARLEEKKLIEKGELSAFYEELAEIVKRYAGRRFEIPYRERTTFEVLTDLHGKRRQLKGADVHLRAVLEAADRVKFARLAPGAEACRQSLDRAWQFLGETRPRPEPGASEEASA